MRSIVFLLFLGVPFFFLGGPGYYGSRSFLALWDLGHVLFFFLTSLWFLKYFQYRNSGRSFLTTFSYVFLIVLVLGIVVEGLQMCSGDRLPDVNDVLRNQLGCLLAFIFFYPRKEYGRNVFLFLILIAFSISLMPLRRAMVDEWLAREQFPILSDFETSLEIDRWANKAMLVVEKGPARHGDHSLQVQLSTDKYSGVSLKYFNKDWRGYGNLLFSVYNPDGEVLELVCRVHDNAHNNQYNDRFNRKFLLRKGWNDLVVSLQDVETSPKDRLLDLSEVEKVGFFVVEQEREWKICIDFLTRQRLDTQSDSLLMKAI